MLLSSIMDHRQPFARVIPQQVLRKLRERHLPKAGLIWLWVRPVSGTTAPSTRILVWSSPVSTSAASLTAHHWSVNVGWRRTVASSMKIGSHSSCCSSSSASGSALKPSLVRRTDPDANRLLVPIEPLGNLVTALAINQQQVGVIALPRPHIVGTTKGCPRVLSCHRRVRDCRNDQAFPPQRWSCSYTSRA
jgi:hypothetical protein